MVKIVDTYWEGDYLPYADSGNMGENYSWSTQTKFKKGKRWEEIAYNTSHEDIYYIKKLTWKDTLLVEENKVFPNNDRRGTRVVYTYDYAGNRIETTEYGPDGNIRFDRRYDYENGRLVKAYHYNYLGKPTMTIDYSYDDKGQLVEQYITDPFDDDSKTVYEYDEHGNQIEERSYLPPEKLNYRRVRAFDEDGRESRHEYWRG